MTVAERYSKGDTYRQISENLHIAPATVRNHIGRIYQKLGVSNKAELIGILANRSCEFGLLPEASRAPVTQNLIDVIVGNGLGTIPGVSIAVLPFEFLGQDGDEYIGYGVAADVQHALSRCHDIFISGRSSSLSQFHARADAVTVGRAGCAPGPAEGGTHRPGAGLDHHLGDVPQRLHLGDPPVDDAEELVEAH